MLIRIFFLFCYQEFVPKVLRTFQLQPVRVYSCEEEL
jgi:hypothetical protein